MLSTLTLMSLLDRLFRRKSPLRLAAMQIASRAARLEPQDKAFVAAMLQSASEVLVWLNAWTSESDSEIRLVCINNPDRLSPGDALRMYKLILSHHFFMVGTDMEQRIPGTKVVMKRLLTDVTDDDRQGTERLFEELDQSATGCTGSDEIFSGLATTVWRRICDEFPNVADLSMEWAAIMHFYAPLNAGVERLSQSWKGLRDGR